MEVANLHINLKEFQKKLKNTYNNIVFEEARHLYFVNGKHYKSVSKKVEGYVPPFDEIKWLPICARKEGLTEHELKHKWQTINITACELGHRVHDFLEHFEGHQYPTLPQEKAGVSFLRSLSGKYQILGREFRVRSNKYKYCGTMDLPLLNMETGKIVIADYKTNGDLFKTFGYMYAPFDYLENNAYNHYQIQLSLYQGALIEEGYEVEDRWVVYLKADGTYEVLPTWDFTKDLSKDFKMKLAA